MITLRYYQQEAIDALFSYFEKHTTGNPLVALPTGAGKSMCIAGFLSRVYAGFPSQRTMMLTHRKELISQNFKALMRCWPLAPAGIFSAGLNTRDHTQPITFAGVQSVFDKFELFGHIDLVLVDEAHLISPKAKTMYMRFLAGLRRRNPRLRVIGFTATAFRSDSGSLIEGEDALFTHICYDRCTRDAFLQLVNDGFLVPPITKRTDSEINTKGVGMRGGDFIESALAKRILDDAPHIEAAVDETIREGSTRTHWLVFTVNVEHATAVCDLFKSKGVSAAVYHSKQAAGANDAALKAFKKGELRCLINVNCLTTGLDVPQIDLIAIMRPTRSIVLWVQMLGRGTRPAPGKTNVKVLDFGHCAEVLGPINDPVVPNRKAPVEDCPKCPGWRKFREDDGQLTYPCCPDCGKSFSAPMTACPQCSFYNYSGRTTCEQCGFEFPRERDIKAHASEIELMATNAPPPVVFLEVEKIDYALHEKNGRQSLRVTYCHGLQTIDRYLCFEHEEGTYPRTLAKRFWRRHTYGTDLQMTEVPSKALTAYMLVSKLREPFAIQIQQQGKYHVVLDELFEEKAKAS